MGGIYYYWYYHYYYYYYYYHYYYYYYYYLLLLLLLLFIILLLVFFILLQYIVLLFLIIRIYIYILLLLLLYIYIIVILLLYYHYMGASQNRRSGTRSGTTPVPYPRSIPPFIQYLFEGSVPYLCSIPLIHTLWFIYIYTHYIYIYWNMCTLILHVYAHTWAHTYISVYMQEYVYYAQTLWLCWQVCALQLLPTLLCDGRDVFGWQSQNCLLRYSRSKLPVLIKMCCCAGGPFRSRPRSIPFHTRSRPGPPMYHPWPTSASTNGRFSHKLLLSHPSRLGCKSLESFYVGTQSTP